MATSHEYTLHRILPTCGHPSPRDASPRRHACRNGCGTRDEGPARGHDLTSADGGWCCAGKAPAVSAKGGKDVHAVVAAHPRDRVADCGITNVAVQSRMGLLSRWPLGHHPDHRADLAVARTT